MADLIYQTLSEFIKMPFGKYDNENYSRLNTKYNSDKSKIKIKNVIEYKDTFMIHLKIPSESKPGEFYDVVIQFLPGDESMKKELTIQNYYIQFFSNSPSFIYRYAVLYKTMGFMIDAFQEKMDQAYANTLPSKTNAEMKLTYDKSLFYACKFLLDNNARYLSKPFLRAMPKVNFHKFVDEVFDYNGNKPNYSIYDLEASFNKELLADIQRAGRHMSTRLGLPGSKKENTTESKERTKTSTFKPTDSDNPKQTGIHSGNHTGILSKKKPISKIKAKVNTFKTSSIKGMRATPTTPVKPKIRGTRSTRKG